MDQRIGGDAGQPFARLLVVGRLRLVGDVAAGHHRRAVEPHEQERVQRRRRQHEAQRREARRDVFRQPLRPVGAQEYDRRSRAAEEVLFVVIHAAIAADDRDVGRHQRERLALAALQPAKPGDRLGIGRVAGEVKPAEPLDRDDFALEHQAARGIDVVEGRAPVETGRPAVEPD